MKECIKCNIKKNYDLFKKNICLECILLYQKEYYYKNLDKIKKRYILNRDKNITNSKINYQKNKEEKIIYSKKYYDKNKKEISNYNKLNRDNINKKKNKRYKEDYIFRCKCLIRANINSIFKRKNIKKDSKTEEILGCSYSFLKNYLENKFENWMSWDNHGYYNGSLNYGWDIDHIIPLSKSTTKEEIMKLNHYTNLQPLCSKINRDIKKDN